MIYAIVHGGAFSAFREQNVALLKEVNQQTA
jgi:hypothetical protein